MPTYSYRCDKCEGQPVTDVVKSVKEYDKEELCATCKSVLVRHFAGKAPPVHFKGGGWYHTTHANGKHPGNK